MKPFKKNKYKKPKLCKSWSRSWSGSRSGYWFRSWSGSRSGSWSRSWSWSGSWSLSWIKSQFGTKNF